MPPITATWASATTVAGNRTFTTTALGLDTQTIGSATLAFSYGGAGTPLGYTNSNSHYYITDHLGSVFGMFFATGTYEGGYSYSPYGEARSTGTATAITANTQRYIGGCHAGIIFTIIVVLLLALIYAKTIYKNTGPDEALIITGKKSRKTIVDGATLEESGQRVVHGQGVFITPFFQKAFKISLRSRAIEITAVAQDRNGITLSVEAVAIVKVGWRVALVGSAGPATR